MNNKITPLESKILFYINDYTSENGYPPTVREIAAGCYISPSVAHKYLWRLSDKGLIEIVEKKSRCIKVKKKQMSP